MLVLSQLPEIPLFHVLVAMFLTWLCGHLFVQTLKEFKSLWSYSHTCILIFFYWAHILCLLPTACFNCISVGLANCMSFVTMAICIRLSQINELAIQSDEFCGGNAVQVAHYADHIRSAVAQWKWFWKDEGRKLIENQMCHYPICGAI